MSELPEGWAAVRLGEIITIRNGYAFKSQDFVSTGVPVVKQSNLTGGDVDLSACVFVPPEVAHSADAWKVTKGDLLLGMSGSIGEPSLYQYDFDAVQNQRTGLIQFAIVDPAHRDFVKSTLQRYEEDYISRGKGLGVQNVSAKDIESTHVWLPPLAEQRRIVAKLDALTARTARARADLDRIPALAARYKQGVMAKAFRGELLEQAGAGSPKDRWRFGKASEVCEKVQSGGTPKAGFDAAKGVPFLKVYNLVGQKVDFGYRSQYVAAEVHAGELRKSMARPGDVLMNIVGPPLGKVAVVPSDFPEWNINQALTLFRPSDEVRSKWLFHFLCGGESVQSVINETRGSAGQVNISLSQCRNFVLPVPSLDEQDKIIARLESALAEIDRLTTAAAAARRLLDRLDQAVLAKAFRGELVPQDPADEPASVLLDRIRAERAAAPKAKRGRKVAA